MTEKFRIGFYDGTCKLIDAEFVYYYEDKSQPKHIIAEVLLSDGTEKTFTNVFSVIKIKGEYDVVDNSAFQMEFQKIKDNMNNFEKLKQSVIDFEEYFDMMMLYMKILSYHPEEEKE